jgi:glycosyltransferase involved in cell wall biosynthesis
VCEGLAADRINGGAGSDVRVTLIGPMPPPINGQSVVMSHMVSELAPHFPRMRIADIGEGDVGGRLSSVMWLRRSIRALWSVPGSDAVYMAVKAGHGMWLTTAAAGLARLTGAQVFLHHHSYIYVRERKSRMVALTRAAGPHAHHVVLSSSMASELRDVMPEIHRLLVVGNAGLVDRALLELPLKADDGDLVLGHLSNLSLEKGIAEVVDLASSLHRAGVRVRLVVGGPTVDWESRAHLDRAARELGELFEYQGPVTGDAKLAFFQKITHFVFPSRYVHEAAPLVLYEAMAAGAVCVATQRGSISEQLEASRAVLATSADSFVEETLPVLAGTSVSTAASQESRRAYLRALSASERQLASLVALLGRRQ